MIPAEGVSGTFIKVAQRVNLRVDLDDRPTLALSPGLSVVARIHIASAEASRGSASRGSASRTPSPTPRTSR